MRVVSAIAVLAGLLLAAVVLAGATLRVVTHDTSKTEVAAAALQPSTAALVLPVNVPFKCGDYAQPINFSLVKVRLDETYTGAVDDAINLNRGTICHGFIGRIEVDTWIGDGVKVGSTAENVTVGGGYIYCHAKKPDKHQDGVQALGGNHIHFENVDTYCPTSNNASFFVTGGNDITCRNCALNGGAQTVSISGGTGNGVFDSLVYTGKFTAYRHQSEAVGPVFTNNVVVPCALNCP